MPSVGVCIGGNNSSFLRVSEMVKRGMPVLLVNGSGGAADLMSDLVGMLRAMAEEEGKNVEGQEHDASFEEFSRRGSGLTRRESAPAEAPPWSGEGRHRWESEEKMRLVAALLLVTEDMDDTALCQRVSAAYGFKYPLKCAPRSPHLLPHSLLLFPHFLLLFPHFLLLFPHFLLLFLPLLPLRWLERVDNHALPAVLAAVLGAARLGGRQRVSTAHCTDAKHQGAGSDVAAVENAVTVVETVT